LIPILLFKKKIIEKIVRRISHKCDLPDSVSKTLKQFLDSYITQYIDCRKENGALHQKCILLRKELKDNMLKKFGKTIYKEYISCTEKDICRDGKNTRQKMN
jgi:hypothetical protein